MVSIVARARERLATQPRTAAGRLASASLRCVTIALVLRGNDESDRRSSLRDRLEQSLEARIAQAHFAQRSDRVLQIFETRPPVPAGVGDHRKQLSFFDLAAVLDRVTPDH